MGINSIKKCTVLLSFSKTQSPASPGYTPRHAACQPPGLKIFGGVLPFLRSFRSGVSRAPGASQLSPEDHSINGGFPGVWELHNPSPSWTQLHGP